MLTVITLLGVVLLSVADTRAQDVSDRTLLLAEALSGSSWTEIEDGLSSIQASTEPGPTITAHRFDMTKFRVSIAEQSGETGDRANEVGRREQAIFVANAGFFSEDNQRRLAAVGLLSLNGERQGSKWQTSGGYLVIEDKPSIQPTRHGPPVAQNFVQSKPVLIEPGGKWAMNTDQGNLKRRTLVCLREQELIVALVSGSGLSLFEAGWLLRSPEMGGFFDCDSAIAMDGGGSTQAWLRDQSQYHLRGVTPVHNFLVVKAR